MSFDWNRIQEQDKVLTPVYGPGFTGLCNLGNTCYMASVVQALFNIPYFQQRYYQRADSIFKSAPSDPNQDLETQLAKLGKGLLSGLYSKQSDDKDDALHAITPRTFKTVVGKGHAEFSTMRQQDAVEFFQYIMTLIERDEFKREGGKHDPSRIFKFKAEERIQCSTSGAVKYATRTENVLSIPIPLEKASNLAEVAEYEAKLKQDVELLKKEGKPVDMRMLNRQPVRPKIKLEDCFKAFGQTEEVPDFYSTAIHAKTTALRNTKLASFPEFLVVQLKKFYVAEDWTPKKLDVFVEVPDVINLKFLRGNGLQSNEKPLPETDHGSSSQPSPMDTSSDIKIDEGIVMELMSMGFPKERCEKAVHNTKNEGAEQSMNWLLTHMDDPDIDEPIKKPTANPIQKPSVSVNEESVVMLTSMGFSKEQSIKALKATENNIDRATEWIFSHMDDPMEDTPSTASPSVVTQDNLLDGKEEYELVGFISHMGTSTQSGHYVAHLKKDGKWVLFNDNKVVLSENPPKDMGYLYLFQRKN